MSRPQPAARRARSVAPQLVLRAALLAAACRTVAAVGGAALRVPHLPGTRLQSCAADASHRGRQS
jgi:hypothetical protein